MMRNINSGQWQAKIGWQLGVFWIICTLTLAGCGAQEKGDEPLTRLAGTLSVIAPETARVGDKVVVSVGPANAADGIPVTLVAAGSYGPRVYQSSFRDGLAHFVLRTQDTCRSGLVTYIVTAEQARGQAETIFLPGAPVEPLTPLVGARSIIADGDHWSMAVIVPFDSFGNPVADGTPVYVRALHPGNNLEELEVQVTHLLAWTRIYSSKRAGRTTITVQTEDAFGSEATLIEIAGWPVPFGLSANPESLPADGWKLVTLRTDIIRDQYGNILPDGTLVTFVVTTPDGEPRFIPTYTLDGVAKAPLQAASKPGVFEAIAVLYGMESESLEIEFTAGPAVGSFPLVAHKAEKTVTLVAGPLIGPLDQYVPDGTSVRFCLTNTHGEEQCPTAPSDAGYAVLELRVAELEVDTYTVAAFAGSGSGSARFTIP